MAPAATRDKAAAESADAPLRESVYLDDVSVYSLTASRLGSIATEFTDTETSTLGGEVESWLEGFGGFAKGSVRAKSSSSRVQSSQVLRKSRLSRPPSRTCTTVRPIA